MEPRPRAAQLARQSLTTSRYAQRSATEPVCSRRSKRTLRITQRCSYGGLCAAAHNPPCGAPLSVAFHTPSPPNTRLASIWPISRTKPVIVDLLPSVLTMTEWSSSSKHREMSPSINQVVPVHPTATSRRPGAPAPAASGHQPLPAGLRAHAPLAMLTHLQSTGGGPPSEGSRAGPAGKALRADPDEFSANVGSDMSSSVSGSLTVPTHSLAPEESLGKNQPRRFRVRPRRPTRPRQDRGS